MKDGFSSVFRAVLALLVFGLHPTGGLAENDPPSASPESCGVSSESLRELSSWVRAEELDVRSMIVLRKGKLVLEWYAGGVTRDHNHNIFSVTKSIVATLAGIALHEGQLASLDSTLASEVPDFATAAVEQRKGNITLAQLLSMRSGFPCSRGNVSTGPARELFAHLHAAADRISAILQLDLSEDPGEKFAYNNIDPHLVLAIIAASADSDVLTMAEEQLFRPLGFENAEWEYTDQRGVPPGGYGLRLRALDLAKIGQLYLQRGEWNGRQVLSEQFVDAATSDQTGTGYGFFWWVNAGEETFSAKGVRGQKIFVDPERELVFVVTADLPPLRVKELLSGLTKRVISSCSAIVLSENSVAFNALVKERKAAAAYVPSHRLGLPSARKPQLSK